MPKAVNDIAKNNCPKEPQYYEYKNIHIMLQKSENISVRNADKQENS